MAVLGGCLAIAAANAKSNEPEVASFVSNHHGSDSSLMIILPKDQRIEGNNMVFFIKADVRLGDGSCHFEGGCGPHDGSYRCKLIDGTKPEGSIYIGLTQTQALVETTDEFDSNYCTEKNSKLTFSGQYYLLEN